MSTAAFAISAPTTHVLPQEPTTPAPGPSGAGPAGAGAVLLFRDHVKEVSVFLGETTNNVAELTAVRTALQLVRKRDLPVRVLTDSTYVIGVLTGAMKAKANAELIAAIRAELEGLSKQTNTLVFTSAALGALGLAGGVTAVIVGEW